MCGGTTTVNTPATVTPMSATGQAIEGLNYDYMKTLSPILQNLATTGGSQVGQGVNPDYASMYSNGLDQINTANKNINSLANGQLPSAYQANMNQAVSDAMSPYMAQFGQMANNGVINSSIGKAWNTDAARAANSAALSAYNQNLSSASQIAQQQASSAANPYNYAAGYQSAATSNAKDLLSLATGSYTPLGNTFSSYLNQQTGLSSPASSTVVQNQSPFSSILGSVAGAATGKLWK